MCTYASFSIRSLLSLTFGIFLMAVAAIAPAQDASENSAFGLDVNLSAQVLGIGLVNLDVGPAPHTQASGSTPYSESDQIIGLEAGTILNLLTASAGVLTTDVAFDGHDGFSTSVGQVEGLDVGVSILNLLGLTLGADSVTGVASIEGRCGNLAAEGGTELVGAFLAVGGAGIIDLPVNPPPNTVVDVLGLLGVVGIELILNEQIVTGNGVTHMSMLTNAIRLSINISVPLVGSVGGSVIVSQAQATRNCNTADLIIDKVADPDPATVGQPLTYTVTAHNNGPDTARDVLIIDELPASIDFVSVSTSQGDCSHTNGVVTCEIGNLAAGAAVEVTVVVVPLEPGEIVNTATAVSIDYDPDPDSSTIIITTPVDDADTGPGEANLALAKSASPSPGEVGQPLTFEFSLLNQGPDDATNVVLSDSVPPSFQITGANASAGGNCGISAQTVTCDWTSLASGASASATIDTLPQQAGTFTNGAIATSDQHDPDPGSASDSVTVVIDDADSGPGAANLILSKSANPNPGIVGQPVGFEFSLQNEGPDDATNVVMTDHVPAGFQITGTSASDDGSCEVASQSVTCNWIQIAGGTQVSATINTVPQQAGTFTNNATAISDQEDPDPDSANDSIVVEIEKEDEPPQQADLALQATANPDPVTAGTRLTYSFTVTNLGPADAQNALLTHILPANVHVQSADATAGGQCQINGGAVSCEWQQVQAFDQAAATIAVVPQQPGTLATQTEVGADTPDPDLSNNTAGTSVTVQAAATSADLSLNKSVSPSEIEVNESSTFTLQISNAGPNAASAVTVTDTMPAGLVIDSVSVTGGGQCDHSVASVQCAWTAIPAGVQETVSIQVTAVAAGTFTNSASVTSETPDPAPENSTDSVTLVVHPIDNGRPVADLFMVKHATPESTVVGQPILFSFDVVNNGPDAATDVRLRDMLPSAISILSVSADSDGICTASGNRIDCGWAEVDVGQTVRAVLVVTSEVPGTYTNAALTFSPDSDDPCPICAQDDAEFEFTAEEAFGACELYQASRNTAQVPPRHALNAGGNTLLYTSNENPTGDNPSRHRALYEWDVLEKTRGDRLTRAHSGLELVAASRDIQRVMVRSGAHPVTGDATGSQMFRLDALADQVDSLASLDPFGANVATGNYGRITVTIEDDVALVAGLEGQLREVELPGIDPATVADARLSGNDRVLVFSARPAGSTSREVFRLDIDSGDLAQLTSGGGSSRPAGISSTGQWVVVVSDAALAASAPDGLRQAYVLDADGATRRVGPDNAEVYGAAISHNGNRAIIAHAEGEGGALAISAIDLDGQRGTETLYRFPDDSAGNVELVSINQGGNVLSFNSSMNLTDQNPAELPQAYLLDCFEPRHGLWGNRARSGHGMEVNLNRQNVLFNFWFTYTPQGDPTWYMIIGDLVGRSWEATMYATHLGPDGVETNEVGTMWAGFSNNEAGLFAWNLAGEPGFEPFAYREFVRGPPEIDFSGSYYDPADSGWGFSHVSLREVHIATLYYYDGEGNPVWAQGVADEDESYELNRFHGTNLCPGCDGPASTSVQSSGMMFIDFASQSTGQALFEAVSADGSNFARDTEIRALARPAP